MLEQLFNCREDPLTTLRPVTADHLKGLVMHLASAEYRGRMPVVNLARVGSADHRRSSQRRQDRATSADRTDEPAVLARSTPDNPRIVSDSTEYCSADGYRESVTRAECHEQHPRCPVGLERLPGYLRRWCPAGSVR